MRTSKNNLDTSWIMGKKTFKKPLQSVVGTTKSIKEAMAQAKLFLQDKAQLELLLQEAKNKASAHKKSLDKVLHELAILICMVKDWASGRYSVLPVKTLLYVVGAILYFVNPLDMIPDFFPISGFLDDVTIIGVVINSIRKDLEAYNQWKQAREEPCDLATGTEAELLKEHNGNGE